MHTINDGEGHFKNLLLFPDYASSGLWCSCGLGLGDPKEELNLPYEIIDLVDLWNSYWEAMDEDAMESGRNDYSQNQIINTGRILAKMISRHISCEFVEERSRIYPYK